MENKNIEIWIRLGAAIRTSPEKAREILGGDRKALKDVLSERSWNLDGESYIPESVAESLRLRLGLDLQEHGGDVDFNIGSDFNIFEKIKHDKK